MLSKLIACIPAMGYIGVEQKGFVLQVDYIEPLIFTRLGKVGDGEDAGVPEFTNGLQFPVTFYSKLKYFTGQTLLR